MEKVNVTRREMVTYLKIISDTIQQIAGINRPHTQTT